MKKQLRLRRCALRSLTNCISDKDVEGIEDSIMALL